MQQSSSSIETVGVVGLGYVGLPIAIAFAQKGLNVVGVDINSTHVDRLISCQSSIEDVPDATLAAAMPRLSLSTDYRELKCCQAILLCVPTPLTRNHEPDLTPLISSARSLAQVLEPGQLVVLESTTYPGTTRETLSSLLEESTLKAGEDFHLAFSPERIDPGRTDYQISNTPKIVGGLTAECSKRAEELYSQICEQILPVSTPEVAELAKLLENIFRSVNIALVNEIAMVADRMNIDIWEVVDAASSKPFGFMRFEPGPGMGGHCLPVDPFYLSWKAREYDISTEFIELAGKVNQQMPYFCFSQIERELNNSSKSIRGSKVLVLGVSYKSGIGDLRESPALKIIALLKERGAIISYHDPYIPELPEFGLKSIELHSEIDAVDIAAVVTAHPGIDYSEIKARANQIVDFRGVTRSAHIQQPIAA